MNAVLPLVLRKVGAFDARHTGRTLGDHLLGTYRILKDHGCEDAVCIGGGIHSLYGTSAFKTRSVLEEKRGLISELFGERAERLAYLFSILNRPKGLETGRTHNWQTGERVDVSDDDMRDLRLIEAANLIEQGGTLDKWPVIRSAWGDP